MIGAICDNSVNGLRMAEQRDGAWTWTHSDHLHSATVMTDASGADVRRLAYSAFGEPVENTGTGDAPTYTYTAKEADAFGLMYYGARYYDPALARFITADTLYDRGPQGLNRYSYALNNPILYNDPTGHFINGPGVTGHFINGAGKESPDPNGEGCLTGNPDDGMDNLVFHENDDDPNSIHYGAPYQNSNGSHRTYTMGQMDFMHPNIPNLTVGDILGAYLTAASMTPDDMLMEYVQSAADQRGSRALSALVFVGAMVLSVDDVASPNTWKKAKNSVGELLDAGKSKVDDVIEGTSKRRLKNAGEAIHVTPDGIALPKGTKHKIPDHYVENPYGRSGSYGEIVDGKFQEKLRIDPATPPGKKGPNYSHYHKDGKKPHYGPKPGDKDPGFLP